MKTNLKNLKFNILTNLQQQEQESQRPRPNQIVGEAKNVIIASPHPGSSNLIISSVQSVLNNAGNQQKKPHFEIIDYQAALFFVDHILQEPSSPLKDAASGSPFILNSPLKSVVPSKAFSPGLYEIEDVSHYDEEEEDEEDDEDEPDNRISSGVSRVRNQIAAPQQKLDNNPRLFLSLNLLPNASKPNPSALKDGDRSVAASSSFQLANLTLASGNADTFKAPAINNQKQAGSSLKSQTIYDRVLSDTEINEYLLFLKKNIMKKHQNGDIGKAVLIVRDVTDLLEFSRNGSGKRLFYGLMDLVSHLRSLKIPSLLIGSCTPSLMDQKNLQKDVEFYTQIIDGNLPNFSSKAELTMAADGTLFQTSLDSFEDLFDKVQLLPPAKTFYSLRSLKGKKETARSFKTHQEQQFLLFQYLSQQDRDMRLRVAEINTKMILDACISRGISLNFSLWNLMCEKKLAVGEEVGTEALTLNDIISVSSHKESLKRQAQFPVEAYALEMLTKNIWNFGAVDRLLKLAFGSRLDSIEIAPPSPSNDTHVFELDDFETALKIMYETDLSRCPSVLHADKDVSPAEGDGGVEKFLDDLTPAANTVPLNSSQTLAPKPKTVLTHTKNDDAASTSRSDDDSISAELKRTGVKLSKHEKRILSTVVNPERLSVQFKDLVLPPSTKLVLQTLVTLPLLRPEFFQSGILSRSSINGVLLFGPPGTGKTMLAKAIAKSSGAWFMNVSLSDIFEKYVGEGEKNVKAIFSLARKLGGPCIIFLDEVDAVFGTRRSDSSGSSRREIMNEFMAEWDGLISNNHGLVVLGATNRPFDLDDAILRRMPRRLLVDLPTEAARVKILESHLRDEELDSSIDLADLAKKTVNYSGSDLKNVCIAAALARMKECIIQDYLNRAQDGCDETQLSIVLEQIDDWGSYLADKEPLADGKQTILKLAKRHIDIGLKECPPSLSDEMQTLVELRKWDGLYGDGASKRNSNGRKGIGFGLEAEKIELLR